MSKLKIIWLSGHGFKQESCWEYDYITKDLFSLFDVEVFVLTDDYNLFIDNSLIVYSSDDRTLSKKIQNYLEECDSKKLKYNLLHLSNEQLNHNCDYYSNAKVVFRNYFDPSIKQKNVVVLPLGYKTGFTNNNPKKLKDKKYDYCFIGQPKWDRFQLIDIIKKNGNSYIHTINQWDSPQSLKSKEMQDILKLTKIVPCPMGNILPETFRFYETLESGSIPVIRRYNGSDYYSGFFKNHPIPTVNDWNELPLVMDSLINNGYDSTCTNINNWYATIKQELRQLVYVRLH